MRLSQVSHLITKNVISVEPDCLLKQAVATMQQHQISFLIIARNNKPLGVLSERDIVRLACNRTDPEQVQVKEIMTSPVITTTEDANIFQVYDLFSTKNIRHAVVVDNAGLIAGVTTLTNILDGLSLEYFIQLKQITHIMSQNLCTLNADDTVQQALELMAERQISCVIITCKDKPIGIITERDIARLYSAGMRNNATTESVMSRQIQTVDSDTFIPQANAIMQKKRLRHLIVVHHNGRLAGLISQSDIARRIKEHYVSYLRTLLKKQGQELAYEHQRFSILFEQNPNAVISLDIQGNIMDINQASVLLSGYSQQEMIGKSLEDFIHTEDAIHARESFHNATKGDIEHTEFRILKKSKRVIHVFNSYIPIYTDNNLRGVYAVMHDISDTKHAQKRVRMAEEKTQLLSQALEQAGDSVIITNDQGIIEFVNTAFAHITGYTQEEAVGNKPSILKSGEQDQAFYEKMWSTITQGKTWQSRLIDRRKNGEFYPAELSISPVYNRRNEITHFIGIKRDLTERDELEQKFHQAQKMESLGTLVSGISHDFNNMLSGMIGNLYLAKKRVQKDPYILQKLGNIEKLSLRASDMIQQLLTYARKDQVDIKQLPLNPFIKETLKFLRTSLPENITLNHNICNDTLLVNGDKTLIYQVLMNLVSNAHDALKEVDEPSITIGLELFQPNDAFIADHIYFKARGYAHLSVEDNGCGIPENQIASLFEPFFTTKKVGEGTGLGLAMVFGAIKTHHGYVEVDSIKGKGSTFHVYLPLLEKETVDSTPPRYEEIAEGNGETILLVDDEKHVRETGREVLQSLGYQILEATNGVEAVEVFTSHQDDISLIITDIVMPRLGGVEFVEHIRKTCPRIKIIFVTGYDKDSTLQSNISSGGSTILSKPYNIRELARVIREQLDS